MRSLLCTLAVALAVPSAAHARGSGDAVVHTVKPGDTLWGLARHYHTTVDAIRRRNRLHGDTLRDGRTLVIVPEQRRAATAADREEHDGPQSRGLPYAGKLFSGVQLPTSRAYYRRHPVNSWGTDSTVRNVKRVVEAVQHRYPYVHRLAIGDLSDRNGGHLAPHRSHQSGRDVDIGFYFKRRPAGYPESFVVGTARNLDLAANFYMFERFCDAGSVQEIFLVTELQKLFYDWGKRHGASRATLDHMFQYPSPPGSAHGCIHHEHGHDDHIHVRFKR